MTYLKRYKQRNSGNLDTSDPWVKDYLIDDAAQELARAIDLELVEAIAIEALVYTNGWTDSKLTAPAGVSEWAISTAQWCHTHCVGDYKYYSRRWFFSDGADCTAFLLKWA